MKQFLLTVQMPTKSVNIFVKYLYLFKFKSTVNVLKFGTPKKKEHFIFSPHHWREGTNFAKDVNLIASLCKTGFFLHRIFGIFPFEIKIWLYKFLEHQP